MTIAVSDHPIVSRAPSDSLRSTMAAMRLTFSWFGTQKSLTSEQKTLAANSFDAEGKYLSASKQLLDKGDPHFRAVTSVKTQAIAFFKGVSLPFPEPGIRLIRQDSIAEIDERMRRFSRELEQAVGVLDQHLDELTSEARNRLGTLFNPADYPPSVRGLFSVEWDFPSVEPPQYLRQLNPELYRQECDRVKSRFDEAVQMAEIAFTEELNKMVEHLAERLSGNDDGKPKVFRDSAIENLSEFFDRFKRLNIGSSEELDQVVERARRVIDGVAPQHLRENDSLRTRISSQLVAVQSSLDGLMVDRPRRNILRRAK